MKTVAVIQARMGSTRLPGKVMLPLAGQHVLTHDVARTESAATVDATVVATSVEQRDDIVARYGERAGASVFRGSESDVLDRTLNAAGGAGADVVVRITADCPLLDPDVVDVAVERVRNGADYVSNTLERTFPRGLDVEAFTFSTLEDVHERAGKAHHREHVTTYYHEHPGRFQLDEIVSEDVYAEDWLQNRTDLRLTLDEADDYELLRRVYEEVPFEGTLPIRAAIRHIDENDLGRLNAHVEQKAPKDGRGDSC